LLEYNSNLQKFNNFISTEKQTNKQIHLPMLHVVSFHDLRFPPIHLNHQVFDDFHFPKIR